MHEIRHEGEIEYLVFWVDWLIGHFGHRVLSMICLSLSSQSISPNVLTRPNN